MFVAQYSLQYSIQYISLPNSSIFLLKTLLYNILSTLYSKVLSNNILELGRKMFFLGKASSVSHFAVCVECTLPAKYGDSVDLKDGLLNNKVCRVKFPVVESYFLCNTTHTELHRTVLSWPGKC